MEESMKYWHREPKILGKCASCKEEIFEGQSVFYDLDKGEMICDDINCIEKYLIDDLNFVKGLAGID